MKRNLLDNVIAFVSPASALQRLHARARLQVADKQFEKIRKAQERKYDGAAKGRHYSDWYSPNLSVNQEVLASLSILRERSRELCRNNPYAIRAVAAIRNNVVGTGIIPTFKGKVGKNQLKAIKDAWKDWAEKTGCDYDDNNIFYGLQSLVMRVIAESGECLIRKVRGTSTDPVPLRLQILESDFIDSSRHTGMWESDNTITYYGIKFGRDGRRIGYWLFKNHPSEFGQEAEFVKADEIIHIYEVERPGQIRGVPFSCGVMTRLKDLDDYEFAERTRTKVAAAFAVFITEDGGGNESTSTGTPGDLERIEPGMIRTLYPGQKVEVAQPPSTNGFGEYVKSNIRGISAGFGLSYETLSNDYSNVNFSSGRMGWIEFHRSVERLQWLLMIPRFCDKMIPWFIEACQVKGIIPFSSNIIASWTAPRREMIDPSKEITALKEQVRAGFCSWQDVVKALGYIPEELIEEIKQDKEMWDKLELKPTVDPRFDTNRPPDAEPEEETTTDDVNKD